MSNLGDEIEEASRGRKLPHELKDKEDLLKKKAREAEKKFDKLSAEKDSVSGEAEAVD